MSDLITKVMDEDFDRISQLSCANSRLLTALRDIKELLGPDSPYTVKRADGGNIDLPEAIRIGNIFERADELIAASPALPREEK